MAATVTGVVSFRFNQNHSVKNWGQRGMQLVHMYLAMPSATSSADGTSFVFPTQLNTVMGMVIEPISGYIPLYDHANSSIKFFQGGLTGTGPFGICSGDFTAFTSVPALAWGY